MEVREAYKAKISNILNPTTVEARAKGGPVVAGKNIPRSEEKKRSIICTQRSNE